MKNKYNGLSGWNWTQKDKHFVLCCSEHIAVFCLWRIIIKFFLSTKYVQKIVHSLKPGIASCIKKLCPVVGLEAILSRWKFKKKEIFPSNRFECFNTCLILEKYFVLFSEAFLTNQCLQFPFMDISMFSGTFLVLIFKCVFNVKTFLFHLLPF